MLADRRKTCLLEQSIESRVIGHLRYPNLIFISNTMTMTASKGSKKRTLALVGILGAAAFLAANNANLSQAARQYLLAHAPSGAAVSFRDSRVGRSLFADIPSPSRRLSASTRSSQGRRDVSRRLEPVAGNDLIREKLRKALYMTSDFATTSAETRRLYNAEDEQAAADQDYEVQLADIGMSIPDLVLPPVLSQNLANVNEPSNIRATPLFWHIPKAGGTSIKYMYSACYGLVEASRVGGDMGDGTANDPLNVFEPWPGRKFVNVDTTSLPDLSRARRLGFAESGLADVVFFHANFLETVEMFRPDFPGRLFAMFRHPVERVNSLFHYLQDATWERTYSPETKGWTVQQYVDSLGAGGHDWMTRFLVGKVSEPLDEYDLELAKLILKEKVLVGLTNRAEESQMRFDAYFGFAGQDPDVKRCVEELNEQGGTNKHSHAKILPGSPEWQALASVNRFDIPLYVYATQLYEEQGKMFEVHMERIE